LTDEKRGTVRANVQILIALFTLCFFMFQTILSDLRKWKKIRDQLRHWPENPHQDYLRNAAAFKGYFEPPSLFASPTQFLSIYTFPALPGNYYIPHLQKESQSLL